MQSFPFYLEKIKEHDLTHNTHLNSSGAIFSTVDIIKPQSKKNELKFCLFEKKNDEILMIIEKFREKNENFLDIFNNFLNNFSKIDMQYMKIYHKFLSSIFRNGSYQNCIKEVIQMYNDLVEEFNRFVNEYDILIRVKTFQDLELMPDEYLNYYEKKLDCYLKSIKQLKIQRNTKYLKLVKKSHFENKSCIFEDEFESKNYLKKRKISLNEILEEFDKIYSGNDVLNESMIDNLIVQKLENESQEFKKSFLHNINLNYPKILENELYETEHFLKTIFNPSEAEFQSESFQKNSRLINKNLFNEHFQKEKIIDLPLQSQKDFKKSKSQSTLNQNSIKNLDDLTYSKSFKKEDSSRNYKKSNETESVLNISFQDSLQESKENFNETNLSNKFQNSKKRRKRSERMVIYEEKY